MYDHLSELTCGKCKESYWIPEDLLPARITKGNNKEIIGNVLILRPRQWMILIWYSEEIKNLSQMD